MCSNQILENPFSVKHLSKHDFEIKKKLFSKIISKQIIKAYLETVLKIENYF